MTVVADGPSWIGIGAQRCGTTWFTELLVQHPDVDIPNEVKEHHYLYRFGLLADWNSEAADEYRTTFSHKKKKLGEFTPYYLRAHWSAGIAAEVLPEDTPILVLLRDPIDRFASALRDSMAATMRRYNKWHRQTPEEQRRVNEHWPKQLPRELKKKNPNWRRRLMRRVALSTSPQWVFGPPKEPSQALHDRTWLRHIGSDATWGGMYAAQLDAWTQTIPKDRFMVIQYEKLRKDPQYYADLVWKRMGLDPVPLQGIEKRSRSSTQNERWVPDDYPHVVRALQATYRPDAERLAQRFDIDLGLWKRTMSDR